MAAPAAGAGAGFAARLAAARRFAAGAHRHLLLDAVRHHPANRVGLLIGHAHRDLAGARHSHLAARVAGVGLRLLDGHALAAGVLVAFLTDDVLVAGHLAGHRPVLAAALHAGHRALNPDLAGHPHAHRLHRRRAAGLAAIAAVVPMMTEVPAQAGQPTLAARHLPAFVVAVIFALADNPCHWLAGRHGLHDRPVFHDRHAGANITNAGANLGHHLVRRANARPGHWHAFTPISRVALRAIFRPIARPGALDIFADPFRRADGTGRGGRRGTAARRRATVIRPRRHASQRGDGASRQHHQNTLPNHAISLLLNCREPAPPIPASLSGEGRRGSRTGRHGNYAQKGWAGEANLARGSRKGA